jgi:hypothetical protein
MPSLDWQKIGSDWVGKPDGSYSPPSVAKVNCENPRRKPVLHSLGPNWGDPGGFQVVVAGFSYALHRAQRGFTGCTQVDRVSGLRRTRPRVQSRIDVSRSPGRIRPGPRYAERTNIFTPAGFVLNEGAVS